jgi:hypothetical protein
MNLAFQCATKDYKIGMCCFSAKHAALKRTIKDVLARNQELISTYNFIIIPIKYRNFRAFVYDSAEKPMLNAISLVIEHLKDRI